MDAVRERIPQPGQWIAPENRIKEIEAGGHGEAPWNHHGPGAPVTADDPDGGSEASNAVEVFSGRCCSERHGCEPPRAVTWI